ncbi:MAG TPA: ABC transporter permease [Candidatus Limnocylindrales bacterium]|nr:ABC transporter permease [Candidatus Limnocylindrales bacterium]
MSEPTVVAAHASAAQPESGDSLSDRRALRAARIRAVAFILIGVIALLWASSSFGVTAKFSFWLQERGGASADLVTTVGVLWVAAGVASIVVGVLQLVRGASFRWRRWLLVVIAPWVAATLGALINGKTATMTNVLASSLEAATPITMAALAGILSERSGMFNIALEGKMLVGAFVAAVASSLVFLSTSNALLATLVGVALAMLTCGLLGLLLAWLGIRHKVDQIIAGTVINIGAVGITDVIYLRVLQHSTQYNAPPSVQAMRLPLLADIPVLGPIFFEARPFVYVAYILVIVLTYLIYRTRWGLRLRASGEKPAAAGTVGINVLAIRYRSLFYAGLIAGLAGSYLSLATSGSFQMQMTAGKGFIGLAAVIFGAWHPIGAFFAALVFGFADAVQSLLSILGVAVPPQLLASVPYVVTIIVVAGVVGRVRGPAEAGRPYEQG